MKLDLGHELEVPTSRDARARQAFVSQLRGYILNDLANGMRHSYEKEVAPRLSQAGKSPKGEDDVHAAMLENNFFKFYSAIRYNAQEMVWRSVIPDIERNLEDLAHKIKTLSGKSGGSLTLSPGLAIPENVADREIHLMPGGYASGDSPLAGALYDHGLAVFSAGLMGRNLDDIGLSFANYVKFRFPDFEPKHILDCGTTVGHNAVAWAQTFPRARVDAIDVAPSGLLYGHGRAESLGVPVHFRQMDATELEYPDRSFDLVFSSMFLHELSVRDIRKYITEAHRVLRPGGLVLTMELPPNLELSPYDQFYLDWDCYYNNEPFYRTYRDQNPQDLIVSSGFGVEQYFQFVVPQFSYMPEPDFAATVGEQRDIGGSTGRLSTGVQWFGFGAWKNR